MAFDITAASQALGIPPTPVLPAVPWRAPARPLLTHEGIARKLQELDRLAALDQMPAGQRALEFLRGLNPLAGLDFNAPQPATPPGFRSQPAAPSAEQLADPTEQYRQVARMIPALAQAAPEIVDNFLQSVAARDPRALGMLAQAFAVPGGGGAAPGTSVAELGSAVSKLGTAAREALPELRYTEIVDQAHDILGLPTTAQKLLPPAPERKLLTAGAPAREMIEAPAVRGVDGQWYTGRNHDMASQAAADAIRKQPGGLDLMRKNGGSATVRGSDSFKTTGGRIVDRNEGLGIARANQQTNVAGAYAQLHSSDLTPASAFVNQAHDVLGLPPVAPPRPAARIEPSPGALANKDTQPFETLQLKKPLAEHSGDELNELQRKVEKAHARATVAIESGAIGTTKPMEYDLQVLNDERARRAALTGPRRAAPGEPLTPSNAPQGIKRPTLIERPANADEGLWNVAAKIRRDAEYGHERLPEVPAVNPEAGKFMAETYDRLVSEPENPVVQRAYRTFIDETRKQYDDLKAAGYTFDFVEHDPYKNSADMLKDLRENKHLSVYKTKPGEGHPLMSAEENDIFRGVHDALGHGVHGYQFGPKGEENAFRAHAYLYSPEAQRAMATETRGQNSWYNFGPESNKPVGKRPFAQQKAALWPAGQLGEYNKVLGPGPLSRRLAPQPAPTERVFHGTAAKENFGIPSIPSDVGVHVGTKGQAEERVSMLGSDIGPMQDINDVRERGRILPLESSATNMVKLTRDLGDWHPNTLVAQLVQDKALTVDEGKKLLAQFNPESYDPRPKHALIKQALEKKGYHGIEYPNKFEADQWHPGYNPEPTFAKSKIIFDPMKHLRNPLIEPEGAAARAPLPQFPRVLGGQLPKEDLRGLAMATAVDPNYINMHVQDIASQKYPMYAPYLKDPKTAATLEQMTKKFRAMSRRWTPFEKPFNGTVAEGNSYRPSILSLAASPEGQAIKKWYEGWKGAVGNALPPDAAEMLTRFSAILSAQKSPKDEVGMALAALDKWAHGEPVNTGGYMTTTGDREKQLALAAKDQRWGKTAHKTSGYYLARKGFKQTGALDRHVIRAYTGTDKVTPAQYEVLWHRVNADAEKMGMPFDEFQASVWGGQTKYAAEPGTAGAAPEDWLAYHLASGDFDRLIKKYPGLEKLRAQGEQQIERQGMKGLLGEIQD